MEVNKLTKKRRKPIINKQMARQMGKIRQDERVRDCLIARRGLLLCSVDMGTLSTKGILE